MDERNKAVDLQASPIGKEQLKQFVMVLERYKSGKKQTETRIVASENWWKLRNGKEERKDSSIGLDGQFSSSSGWLHNVITSKHADAIEAYPEPNLLPREAADKAEAKILSSILPCILEQNHHEKTYSDEAWQKLKSGTGVLKIVWDKSKLNGLGDIGVERSNILNLYWEPGITDIQKSRYFFHTETVDSDILEELYPETKDKLKTNTFISTKFLYDDSVSTDGKVTVIEVYYHKHGVLQYCKFVNDVVLYATENDPQMVQRGLYDHGKYPYVFDPLFPIEGSPCGYGYVDICRNPQTAIDILQTAMVKNAMVGATPRYFKRQDGGINEAEYLDLTKPIVHVDGNLGEDSIRVVDYKPLDGNYIALRDGLIAELRETSGNTETSTGSTSSGVTAASAIAALQEASGKGSRDSNLSAYRAYSEMVEMIIELIRQFYTMPRQFRIVGEYGKEEFVTYTNKALQMQVIANDPVLGEMYRKPVFDIKVSAQKKNVYTKVSQNELALQFFQLGFFNPQMADQAIMCIELMDFDGKDNVLQKIAQNGTMFQKLTQYMQMALMLCQQVRPDMVAGIAADIQQTLSVAVPAGGGNVQMAETDALGGLKKKEHAIVENAREKSNNASQPDGGKVTKEANG